jgi:hypothetical protein
LNAGVQNYLDALVFEECVKAFSDVVILVVCQAVIAVDYGDVAAEATHRLR